MTSHPRTAPDTLDHGDHWRRDAACRGKNDAMFPDNNVDRIADAKAICRACPVIQQCLDDVMRAEGNKTKDSRYGIAAGLTPAQRHHLYRKQTGRWTSRSKAAA